MLELKSISKNYGDLEILKIIDLKIKKSEFVAIMGPSGSGKSTLLGLAAGLDKPSSGEVILDNQTISNFTENQLASVRSEKIGFIFQNFQLVKNLTALENVYLPVLFQKNKVEDFEKKANLLLEKVNLTSRAKHFPGQLSGGEEQRVAVARAFMNNPKILFADEPTGNLDLKNGNSVLKLLLDLKKENGTTLLIVTHDEKVAKLADRIIKMEDGKILPNKKKK